jgi:hypothetical protein
LVGSWIESNCIIPNGPQRGAPYLLTDEMWLHMLWCYRLVPTWRVHPKYPRPRDGFVYYGSQLRRPQKWGKDPFMAARAIAHALGPVQFDGWDARGEPVGRPVDTPWIQLAATSEDQTLNTWRPLYRMLDEGPLGSTPGLDVGLTGIKLPRGDGWIEQVSASSRSRLGNPITWAAFTEPHLMCERDGSLEMFLAMDRNLTGMGGGWMQATNAWDPTEDSAAQQTAEAKTPGVYLDHRGGDLAPLPDLSDHEAVRARIKLKYGDSIRSAGGWVEEDDIFLSVTQPTTGEARARRYYLDEVTVGERDFADPTRWDAQARPLPGESDKDPLKPGDAVALGFDGSRTRDGTALVATRIRDGRLFHLRTWLPPEHEAAPWKIDRVDVDKVVRAAFAAYKVWFLYADPFKWQDYLDTWSGAFPGRVVEFATTNEKRMDNAIERFLTAFEGGELTHNGHPTLTAHMKHAALKKGRKKPPRVDGETRRFDYYMSLVRKKPDLLIDALIAAVLSYAARGQAIEAGALDDESGLAPNLW